MEYNSSQELEYINTDEGRVRVEGSVYYYDYYLKDHLGNTRVVFTDSLGYAETLQVNNYYPFGMRFDQAPVMQKEENNYLYNGKEFQEDYGLNWLDYGARMYDVALGRWHAVDPLADEFYSLTPYNYCANNPIFFIDPDGMKFINAQKDEKEDAEKKQAETVERHKKANKDVDRKEWQRSKRALNKANSNLKRAIEKYQVVEDKINYMKEVSPILFKELDELKDPKGNNIDINVSILDNNATFVKNGEEYELNGGVYARPGKNGAYIHDPITKTDGAVHMKLRISVGGLIFAHEGGHISYYATQIRNYYIQIYRTHKEWKVGGGHAKDDPNGIEAENWEKRYRLEFRNYRRSLKGK